MFLLTDWGEQVVFIYISTSFSIFYLELGEFNGKCYFFLVGIGLLCALSVKSSSLLTFVSN